MPKKARLTPEERYANRRISQENYRQRVERFTLQFSLQDTEAFEWFSKQEEQGKYLKNLILADKERQTGIPCQSKSDDVVKKKKNKQRESR